MTRREAITRNVLGYLQAITIANGYLTDLGNNMSLWRVNTVPKDSQLVGTLRDKSNIQSSGPHTETLHFEIEIGVKSADASQYSALCNAIRDVDAALNNAANLSDLRTTFGGGVKWVADGDDEIDFDLEESKLGKAVINRYLIHRFKEKFTPDLTTTYT